MANGYVWIVLENQVVSQIQGRSHKRQAGAKTLPAENRPAFSHIAVELR